MSTDIQTKRVILQQPPTRAIHPNMRMNHPDFLNGYKIGLRNGFHPDGSGSHLFTDEEMIQDLQECALEEREVFAYVLGCYIGGLIATCYLVEDKKPHETLLQQAYLLEEQLTLEIARHSLVSLQAQLGAEESTPVEKQTEVTA
jgi:hypothetical protein